MLDKSLAYRLSIFISLAVIFVFVCFMVISYYSNKNIIKDNIETKATGISNQVIRRVEAELVTTREIGSNLAEQIIFYSQHGHPDQLLTRILEKYPFINAIHVSNDSIRPSINFPNYFAFRDTNQILFETQDILQYHCNTEKRIFEEIKATNQPGWSEVFTCPRNNKMVVSFYTPIIFTKKTTGERIKAGNVICELSLAKLNNKIQSSGIGEDGFAILFSKNGDYLAHPIEEWILNKSVFSLPDDVYDKEKTDVQKVLSQGLSGSLITYPQFREDVKHWAYYARLKEIDWTLVIAVPYTELYSPINLSILRMLFVSALGIILIYIIIKSITNRLVEPLTVVTSQLRKFSSLTGKLELNTLDEVKLVSQSLNYLRAWYEKYKINQSEEESKNQKQLEDLIQASEIQKSFIKTDFSDVDDKKELDLYALYKPARIVSGDLFDYHFLDDDHLVFTIGDVSGKGVPAAIFMSIAQTVIRNHSTIQSASKIVRRTNRELHTSNTHQFFLTLLLGVLNTKTGVLEYCNAAHTPSYIVKSNGNLVELSKSHGLPLGLYSNKKYSSSKIKLDAGDTIVMYTDGVTDLPDENNKHFGNGLFIENLTQLSGEHPREMVKKIEKSLDIYKGQANQQDDITMLCIRYNA